MNRNFFSLLPSKSDLALTAAGLGMLTLAGCGIGTPAISTPQSVVLPAMSGKVMGGETPLSSAVITLWETDPGNTGYGVATNGSNGAQQLASTTTGIGGGFSFTAGSYTCAPGQFAYLTSTGGDASDGGGTEINNNLVMVAALGSCSNFSGTAAENKIIINVNELSTVAAAYALGSFTTVNDNGNAGTQLVYIGSPANNNATSGSCSGTGTSMTCVAAGLTNAFANANKLVDAVHYDGTLPTGLARTVDPNNSNGSVPQAVINSLGDIMSYCTQSASSGTGGTNCAALFSQSKAAGSGTQPTDTLSSMMNVARAPYNNVGTTCTGGPPATSGGLYCLISGIAAPWAALTAAPHDWSIAIAYTGTSTGASFGSPQYAALDAADNVYVQTSNNYAATLTGLTAMTNAGAGLWSVAQSANTCVAGALAADTNGYIWSSIPATTAGACTYGIYGYTSSGGVLTFSFLPGSGNVCGQASPSSSNCPGFTAYDTTHSIQSTPKPMAFDRFNNLWYARSSSTCSSCAFRLPYTAPVFPATVGTYAAPSPAEGNSTMISNSQIVIDSNSNVYIGDDNTTSSAFGHLNLIYNTGTAAAPTYTSSTGFVTGILPSYDDGGIGLDSHGNVWAGSDANMTYFTPTVSGATSTFGSANNLSFSGTHPFISDMDGGNRFWVGNLTSSGGIYVEDTQYAAQYLSAGSNYHNIRPCYVPSGGTTCDAALYISSTQYYASGDPKSLQIDSAGGIWIAAGASSALTTGFVLQVLGAAYPTWPQISYGVFGTMPQ